MADAGVAAFAMELMPRITRAQSMDVLSSQANLAGYRAVIDAAEEYGRALPMMMTAAGTVPAAKVFIMGVGVAGLQAIATARRLGAIVTATDVRPATKEQVESLGAKFLAVEDEEFKNAQTAGGYAKEMSKEYQAKQAALTAEHIKKQDIVITTALIPGRPAPQADHQGDGGLDAAGLGDRRSRGRARRQCGRRQARRGGAGRRRQDRRLSQRAGAAGGLGLGALRQEPADLPRDHDRQEREELAVNWDDEIVKGTAAHPRRRGRASEFQAEDGGLTENLMEQIANAVDPFVFRLSIFVLAVFVGYYVVWSVTPALHTPLMSVTNAISSVIVVGALLAVGVALIANDNGTVLARAASASSRWCSPRSTSSAASWSPSACWRCTRRKRSDGDRHCKPALELISDANLVALLYLVAGVLFILALRGLSSPDTSRRGNYLGMIGMAIAVLTTLAAHPPAEPARLGPGGRRHRLGGGIGAVIARRVPMTSMPELVAAFHSLVGMAAVLVAAGAFYAPAAFGIGSGRPHPPAEPDRDVARRRHRRHHLHRLGDRLPEALRPHERQADHAAGRATSSTSRWRWR